MTPLYDMLNIRGETSCYRSKELRWSKKLEALESKIMRLMYEVDIGMGIRVFNEDFVNKVAQHQNLPRYSGMYIWKVQS